MFLLLPLELIKVVDSEMDVEEAKSLRLTCKALSKIFADRVLSSITINITQPTLDKDMHKLQCLATRPCATSHATHQLIILSLSPTYVSSPGSSRENSPQLSSQFSPEILLWAEEEMRKFLFGALSSFQNVKRVLWRPRESDETWAHTTLMDAMRTLTRINSLDFPIRLSRIPVPFHWFSGLQDFFISWSVRQHPLDSLAMMVAQSPQLNSISMNRHRGSLAPEELYQLFQYYPKDVPPLRLRHLDLFDPPLRFDDVTIPHLKHLTSFSLKGIDKSDHLQEVWSVLIKAGVWLEKITLNAVSSAFLAYLASYSGLRVLNLVLDALGRGDSLTTQFYAESLTNHAQSLRELRISTYEDDSLWCIGNHNLSLISQCVNLKHLTVGIIHSQINLDSADLDIIKRVVDMAVMSMPQLDALRINPSYPESSPPSRNWAGTSEVDFMNAVDLMNRFKDTIASICTYQAPPSCTRLPLLLVSSQEFLGHQSLVHDGRLMYMASNPPFYSDSEEGGSEISV